MVHVSGLPSEHRLVRLRFVILFIVAELLRVGVAIGLVQHNRERGLVYEFADSELYWKLALNVAAGKPYDDGKRQVLRTPGYPVFLAGCIRLFGDSPVAARHAQAAVGSLSCVLLFFLVQRLFDARTAWITAWVAALYPFAIFLSAVLLSESLFTFVLLLQLLCLSRLGERLSDAHPRYSSLWWAALTGLTGALATLVRPSWLPAMPVIGLLLFAFVPRNPAACNLHASDSQQTRRSRFRATLPATAMMLFSCALALCPWWVRNWKVTSHFVPTTLWVGASLYDGWNERATGASNMEFMELPARYDLDPALNSMHEWEQDRYLRREAWRFARTHPRQVARLAAIKFARFWNPLPNASEWRSWPLRLVSLMTVGPLLALILLGAWQCRSDRRILALLAGPVVYFCVIHLIFVSSVRYREAAMLPAIGLAGAAFNMIAANLRRKRKQLSSTATSSITILSMFSPPCRPSSSFSEAGTSWEDLGGPYTIIGNTLVIRLTNQANGQVIADAVRVKRLGD
jgi:4-amino-4-deoxy-L-arabinose transferase-like glycosyltransferase